MMAAKTTMNRPQQTKVNKDMKPEPTSPISASKPVVPSTANKRKIPAKRSAAIRKAKKPVAAPKKK